MATAGDFGERDPFKAPTSFREVVMKSLKDERRKAAVKALRDAADALTWKKPDKCPCTSPEACCGSEESCDAMQPHRSVVGEDWLRDRADKIEKGEL